MASQWGKISLFDYAADGDLEGCKSKLSSSFAKVDPVDQQGRTPLLEAARYGHKAVVEFLVGRGAKADFTDDRLDGQQAIHVAAMGGHDEVVEYLLTECKVPVDVADKHGDTALHCAAGAAKLSTIELLLKHGADKNLKNENGMSPVDQSATAATTELFNAGKTPSATGY